MKVVAMLFSLMMAGCQGGAWYQQADPRQSTRIMPLWKLYQQCLVSHDPSALAHYVERLRQGASSEVIPASDPPRFFERFVTRQPLRVAVDPKALAVSCTLRAASVTLSAGQAGQAEQLFRSVLVNYPETDFAYYARQAWLGIMRTEQTAFTDSIVQQTRLADLTPPALSTTRQD